MLKDKLLTCAVVGAICMVDCTVCMRGDDRYALIDNGPSEEFKRIKKIAKSDVDYRYFPRIWRNYNECFKIGEMYYRDDGCGDKYPTNEERKKAAFKWFKRSRSSYRKSDDALIYLHHMYLNGEGTSVDRKKASKYARKIGDKDFPVRDFDLGRLNMLVEAGYEKSTLEMGLRYLHGYGGVSQNYAEALAYLERADSDYEAMYCLTHIYSRGLGTTRNQAKASEYIKKCADASIRMDKWRLESVELAAQYGNAKAAYKLGEYYGSGSKAEKYYKQCVEAKIDLDSSNSISVISAYKLSKMYQDKGATIENLENAVKFCKIAANANYTEAKSKLHQLEKELEFQYLLRNAKNGDINAAYDVGLSYYKGDGVCSKDIIKAIRYFEISANEGNTNAVYALGVCYEEQYNHDQALKHYKQCADAGIDLNSPESISVISAYRLSKIYIDNGYNIENLENAVKYCEIAANAGYRDSQYQLSKLKSVLEYHLLVRDAGNGDFIAAYKLGMMYNDGSHCVERDAYEAIKYFKYAADIGNRPEAAYMLGECYKSGENAIKYYKQCADAYFRIYFPNSISIASAYKLAKLYRNKGNCVENLENAVKYCKIAANANYSDAKSKLHQLEKELEFQYLLRNADNGDINAAYKVAKHYGSGDKAEKYYKIAADKGHAKAAYKLGKYYGSGSEAEKYYKQCVEAKIDLDSYNSISVISAYKLSKMYRDKGDTIENLENAVKYCKIAANANYSDAKSKLHQLEKELEFQYLLRNAKNGDIDSAYKVAEHYGSGSKGEKYYKIAADKGHLNAAYELGKLYKTGSEAIKYYKIAANKGHVDAKKALEEIRRRELEAQRKREEEARRQREAEERKAKEAMLRDAPTGLKDCVTNYIAEGFYGTKHYRDKYEYSYNKKGAVSYAISSYDRDPNGGLYNMIEYVKESAAAGSIDACMFLSIVVYGKILKQPNNALRYEQIAADLGDTWACIQIGVSLYNNGYKASLDYFLKANNAKGYHYLSTAYYNGEVCDRNKNLSLEYAKKAKELGADIDEFIEDLIDDRDNSLYLLGACPPELVDETLKKLKRMRGWY